MWEEGSYVFNMPSHYSSYSGRMPVLAYNPHSFYRSVVSVVSVVSLTVVSVG